MSLHVPTPHAWSLVLFLVSISLMISVVADAEGGDSRVLPDMVDLVKLSYLGEEGSNRLL